MDEFTEAYIRALLWSSMDESTEGGGRPMDENYSESDLAPATLEAIERDTAAFQEKNAKSLAWAYKHGQNNKGGEYTAANAGHDYALSRNGHGAGYFDRDMGKVGDKLQEAAAEDGEFQLYVGDDGKVYAFGHEERANEAREAGAIAQDFTSPDAGLQHAARDGFTHYTKDGRRIAVYRASGTGSIIARMYRRKGKYHFTAGKASKRAVPKRSKPLPRHEAERSERSERSQHATRRTAPGYEERMWDERQGDGGDGTVQRMAPAGASRGAHAAHEAGCGCPAMPEGESTSTAIVVRRTEDVVAYGEVGEAGRRGDGYRGKRVNLVVAILRRASGRLGGGRGALRSGARG